MLPIEKMLDLLNTNPAEIDFNQQDADGNTLLHYLLKSEDVAHHEIAKHILSTHIERIDASVANKNDETLKQVLLARVSSDFSFVQHLDKVFGLPTKPKNYQGKVSVSTVESLKADTSRRARERAFDMANVICELPEQEQQQDRVKTAFDDAFFLQAYGEMFDDAERKRMIEAYLKVYPSFEEGLNIYTFDMLNNHLKRGPLLKKGYALDAQSADTKLQMLKNVITGTEEAYQIKYLLKDIFKAQPRWLDDFQRAHMLELVVHVESEFQDDYDRKDIYVNFFENRLMDKLTPLDQKRLFSQYDFEKYYQSFLGSEDIEYIRALPRMLFDEQYGLEEAKNKLFGHFYSLGGTVALSQSESVVLTGAGLSMPMGFTVYMMQGFRDFLATADNSKYENLIGKIEYLMSTGLAASQIYENGGTYKLEERLAPLLAEIQKNGLLINTGWSKHAITLVVMGDLLYRCNTGGGLWDSTIEVYRMGNPQALDATVLQKLYRDSSYKHNKVFIQKELHEILDLQLQEKIETKQQTVGNCAMERCRATLAALVHHFAPDEKDLTEQLLHATDKAYMRHWLTSDEFNPRLLARFLTQGASEFPHLIPLIKPYFKEPLDIEMLVELYINQHQLKLKVQGADAQSSSKEKISPQEKLQQFNQLLETLDLMPALQKDERKLLLFKAVATGNLEEVSAIRSQHKEPGLLKHHFANAFHLAVELDNLEMVQTLAKDLDEAALTAVNNECNIDDFTPLGCARSLEMAQLLVKLGARVNGGSSYETCLNAQISKGRKDIVQFLLAADANVNSKTFWCAANNLEMLEMLPKDKKFPGRTHCGSTSLHKAIELGKLSEAEYLIRHGADPRQTDINGRTPLHFAMESKKEDVIAYCAMHPLMRFSCAHRGDSPAKFASQKGLPEGLMALIKNTEREKRACVEYYLNVFAKRDDFIDEIKQTPQEMLLACISARDMRAFKGCLLYHPELMVTENGHVFPSHPLYAAINHRQNEMVKLLLKMPNLDINKISGTGEHVLHAAVATGNIEMLNLLLTLPNIDVNVPDPAGYTPLMDAIDRRYMDAIKVLLADGRVDLSSVSTQGQTPRDLAEQGYLSDVVSQIDAMTKAAQSLKV